MFYFFRHKSNFYYVINSVFVEHGLLEIDRENIQQDPQKEVCPAPDGH